ncbi:hypothetical protein [Microbacterium sp. B19]|uniref:hypothetical protein n=1 Tax=Microbacterium sp. B19 TaxID=96765 RepID=UPI000349639C|nr:hypothetical protein [Microbacterium sp. B19]
MAKEEPVSRPIKKSEFTIVCASRQAEKGWQDLRATQRNALADAWDFLTRTPHLVTPTNYPLKGELRTVTRAGKTHERWQHKPTLGGSARIWFYVEGDRVYLEDVSTAHPNATK